MVTTGTLREDGFSIELMHTYNMCGVRFRQGKLAFLQGKNDEPSAKIFTYHSCSPGGVLIFRGYVGICTAYEVTVNNCIDYLISALPDDECKPAVVVLDVPDP